MKMIAFIAATVAAVVALAYHESDFGNNVEPTTFGSSAGEGGESKALTAFGRGAGEKAYKSSYDVFIGSRAGANANNSKNTIGIGTEALADTRRNKKVVAIGNYELAGVWGITNTTSINGGQIFVSETFDCAMLRTDPVAAPSNSPFAYMQGNTYIGGTGTTYIAGNVVFNGRSVIVDNTTYSGGGSGTAHLAGSGDLADLTRIPYSSGDCDLFVSQNGSDDGEGTALYPYLTIDRALREVTSIVKPEVIIGVYAGDYPYPSNALFKAATESAIVRLVALEGVDKTSMSLSASGITPEMAQQATSNSTYSATLVDRAVLSVPEDGALGWAHVYGFTFKGRTKATRSYKRATYSGIQFHSCRFTGTDACSSRNYRDMVFSNSVLDNCLIDGGFELNVRDWNAAAGGSGSFAFACGFENSVVMPFKKHKNGEPTNEGYLLADCELYNTLVHSTNAWYCANFNEVSDHGMFDSVIVLDKNMVKSPFFGWFEDTMKIERVIYAVGEQTEKGAYIGIPNSHFVDSYIDTYASVKEMTDDWFYPNDDAFELFGIGYNNSLTRRFKDYLREKNYQGRDGVGVIDLKNTNAMFILAENGDLNVYSVSAVSNNIPIRPIFALFKAEVSAGNDQVVSTSLSGDRYRKTFPKFDNFNMNTTAVDHGDDE